MLQPLVLAPPVPRASKARRLPATAGSTFPPSMEVELRSETRPALISVGAVDRVHASASLEAHYPAA